jgi:hypothetical protein
MAEASLTVRVTKLRRGGNWALWSAHASTYLLKMDLQGYLSQKELKSDDEEKGNRLCKANLLLLMDGPELKRIVDRALSAKGFPTRICMTVVGCCKRRDGLAAVQEHLRGG